MGKTMPTLEEVKEYFKDAEKIECAFMQKEFNISDFKLKIELLFGDYWLNTPKRCENNIKLWCVNKGYAKILSYKKPTFTPIAMRCNQEQFDKIKPKLEGKIKITDKSINYPGYPYLTNNFTCGGLKGIGRYDASFFAKGLEIHETWNEEIFLKACGIKVKKPKEEKFTITKEQILELHNNEASKYVKEWFPSVFKEEKKELVVGKWYKNEVGLFCITNIKNDIVYAYGFHEGVWKGEGKFHISVAKNDVEATTQEVEKALKNEAVRRGFKEGVYFIEPINQPTHDSKLRLCKGKIEMFGDENNKICFSETDSLIYREGVWATIIPTITKSEAEQQLGKKIV